MRRMPAAEADVHTRDTARNVRNKLHQYITDGVRSKTLPDMSLLKIDALADFVEGRIVEDVFPLLDGAVLPRWLDSSTDHTEEAD